MEQSIEELAYGEIVPGVVCPVCGGELVMTTIGAYCDWDMLFVPTVRAVVPVTQESNDSACEDWCGYCESSRECVEVGMTNVSESGRG